MAQASTAWTLRIDARGQKQQRRPHQRFAVNAGLTSTESYCSAYCSDATDEQEVEIQCDRKHAPYALD